MSFLSLNKYLQKIPKLENQLYALADEYENKYSKLFLIYGYSMRDYINHARENYETEKENLKFARVSIINFYFTTNCMKNNT